MNAILRGHFSPDESSSAILAEHEALEAEHKAQTHYWLRRIKVEDLSEQLLDAADALSTAIDRRDAALVGRIVANLYVAYAQRIAAIDMDGIDAPSSEKAAAMALVGEML